MNDRNSTAPGLQFPCVFPVKVMGLNSDVFSSAVMTIMHKHLGPDQISRSEQLSRSGKYLSLTVTFTAQSKAQLDAIYRDLHAHELVLMTL